MVKADNTRAIHVAPYPGFTPDTLVINSLLGGPTCLSVGSTNFSVHPVARNVKEKNVFSDTSGFGPSRLHDPREKKLGYCK